MPTDAKEKGLESLIEEWLVSLHGYEQGSRRTMTRNMPLMRLGVLSCGKMV